MVVFLNGSQLRRPWLFLAACDEYYHCCIKRDRDYTALPVATDATCSGLQILAGLCRDASTASLVNVLPGERPADAYRTVAEHAKPNVPDSIKPYMKEVYCEACGDDYPLQC